MKKQIILLALFVVATLMTFAQNHFAYQAVVRDANGQLLSEKSVTLSWELTHQNGTETGNITATTSKQGLIMVAIAVPEDVVWNGATIKVDVGYGGNTIVGTAQPIFPTPYTLYAEEVNYANLPIVTTITNASDATIPTEGAVKSYGEAISTTLTQNFQAADAALDTRLTDVETELSNKVDQEAGKGLSSNDYTTAEQQKLAGIEDGAQVNVQSDWAEADNSKAAFIVNKPDFDGAVAAMRAELTNLRDSNANLYDSIAALRARIDELPNIPTLELTASDDYPAAVACGNSITITYTATEIPGATYIWTVDGVAEPTTTHELVKTYTPNFFTETHIVKVVAAFQTATDTTTLSLQSHTAPTVGFCIDDKIGQVFIVTAYSTDKIELFDGATLTKTLTAPLYMADLVLPKELPNGNYTAVASDNDGCTTTYTINVNRVATACTVTNINSNEAGSGEQLTSVRDHEGNEYDVVQIGNQ